MRPRQGFTLVEMLVAVALVLLIMVVLSQAFLTATQTFRQLKGLGDLEERLRSAGTILRRDLAADHFEGRRRLSDPYFWTLGPPREGFFRLQQTAALTVEGADGDGIPSLRGTGQQVLHFTVKLRGNSRDDFFSALVPANSPLLILGQPDSRYQDTPGACNGQWAEVAYFLVANGSYTMAGNTQSVPLYALYRRQRLAVPNNVPVNWGGPGGTQVPANPNFLPLYAEVSCMPNPNPQYSGFLYFNNPTDLTIPERRFGMNSQPGVAGWLSNPSAGVVSPNYAPLGTGDDLLLTDVISWDVTILTPESQSRAANDPGTRVDPFIDLFDSYANYLNNTVGVNPQVQPPVNASGANVLQGMNSVYYSITNPSAPQVFDTWSTVQDDTYNYSASSTPGTATTIPLQLTVLAVQVRLRIWDAKTKQTRQLTIVQDM